MKITKEEKGITLVALIITIIVLLILAVVAINAVQNDGIIEYAKNARTEYEKAQVNEQAQLDYYLSQIESSTGKGIVHNGIIPTGGTYYVGVTNTNKIPLDNSGIVATSTYVAGDTFPEPNTGDIYIYEDYEYRYNMARGTVTSQWTSKSGFNCWGVIVRDTTKDSYEEILTTINGIDVELMVSTFMGCESLEKAPKIPDGVTNMQNTFWGCKVLKIAPEIPDGVKIMKATFADCELLEKAPKIPDSVTNMHTTFQNCYSLKTAPVIPSKVAEMAWAFKDCRSLAGYVVIETDQLDVDNIAKYQFCFSIDEGTNTIILKGINRNNDDQYDNIDILNKLAGTNNGGNVKVHNLTLSQE